MANLSCGIFQEEKKKSLYVSQLKNTASLGAKSF